MFLLSYSVSLLFASACAPRDQFSGGCVSVRRAAVAAVGRVERNAAAA